MTEEIIELDFRTKAMGILDEYYGESRDESFKEEIIDFLESCDIEVFHLLKHR